MYRNILVPLDGSKRAEMILPHVKNVAKQYKSKVIFLKVEEEPVMLGHDEVVDTKKYHTEFEEHRNQTESYLSERIEEFQQEGIQTAKKVAYGPVVRTILSAADEVDSDLIALASQGLGTLPIKSMGSVAAGLLQRIDRPLFIVRSAG